MRCERGLYCAVFVILMEVVTSHGHKPKSRVARFLTFNTLDDDLKVELEFTIPFISIPVKKTMETTFGLSIPTVNVNTAALVLGGGVVITTAFIIPYLVKTATQNYPNTPYARLLSNAEFGTDAVLDMTNQLMTDSQGFHRCALKVACWVGRSSTDAEARTIVEKLASNTLISSLVNMTALSEATLEGGNCKDYDQCPMRQEVVATVADRLRDFVM